jgi:flagellar basal-body rod protein FlgB
MTPIRANLFELAQRRLAWAEQRQSVLARNIANASTPGFQPRDLPKFADALPRSGASEPRRTQPNHLPAPRGGPFLDRADQPKVRAPDGNAVAMDEQLSKVADTDTVQTAVTAIYRKYLMLFGMALGKA